MAPGSVAVATGAGAEVDAAQRSYLEYRRRQALELLSLVPEGAVRPLYRQAREWACSRGEVIDPLSLLLDYCDHLLPLLPFEAWMADREAHPAAHLDETGPAVAARRRDPVEPVTVESRTFRMDGREWNALLDVRPDDDV
ncbi:MAG TPA: hypothetical protein VE173_01585, partial [Longimicrobiales bacterium]|nr:hypothetical protein [Longimicrobiales bacterium]